MTTTYALVMHLAEEAAADKLPRFADVPDRLRRDFEVYDSIRKIKREGAGL